MIQQLKRALKESIHNPMCLYYLWKNLHVVRDHFPSIHQALLLRRTLDLGHWTDISHLHVVMRTTDFVMNLNSSRQLEEMGIISKNDVIRVGGCSLFPAARRFVDECGGNLQITIVSDKLSEKGLAQYRNAASRVGVEFDVVESKGHGNGSSFQTQLDIALKDDDGTLVFLLEDDYLLSEEALTIPFGIFRTCSRVIGFNPHFHPDRVRRQDVGRLCAVGNRLYCRVPSTCCTFFMLASAMRRFEKYLRLYDGSEDGSVNVAWKRELCLAPLGWTLAEHLHRSDLSPVQALVATNRCIMR